MQAYSLDLSHRIVLAVQQRGLTQQQAAQRFEVSPATVSRYLKRADEGEDLAAKKPPGKPARLSQALAQRWEAHIHEHPHATIAQQQQWLAQQGVPLCYSAVHANLQRRGFTFKKSPSLPKSATPKSERPSGKR